MSRQVSPSTEQVYGLQRVTRIWGIVTGDHLPPSARAGGAQEARAAGRDVRR